MSSFTLKKVSILKISLISVFFFFYNFIYSSLSQEHIELFAGALYKEIPGFREMHSSGNNGKWFEMESALWLQNHMKQDILFFDLSIEVRDINSKDKNVPCSNGYFELRTTEFDIVTDTYAIECKGANKPGNTTKLEQILKEKIF